MKVLVVGDIMLDTYIETQPVRLSDEAPVMIVKEINTTYALGGAGNVAANLKALGVEVDILGLIGIDEQAEIIKKLLIQKDIGNKLTQIPMITTEKKRILCNGKQMIRVDKEEIIHRNMLILEKSHYDAVVISDYIKGAINEDIIKEILYSYFEISDYFELNTLLIINGKPENIELYRLADILTLNRNETAELFAATGLNYAKEICEKYNIAKIITTLGADGVCACDENNGYYHVDGIKVNCKDITGAGDTFISALTYALINKYPFLDSLQFANRAAAIKVTKNKTDVVTLNEIRGD